MSGGDNSCRKCSWLCYNLTDMEPRQSSPESLSAPKVSPEAGSSNLENNEAGAAPTEIGFDTQRNEQVERKLGHAVESANQPAPGALPQSVSLPAPVSDDAADAAALVVDDNPVAAADEDLIEKEWVDKAKNVINSTKDDPYRREIEVKKLQLDYVRKRYGKVIGESGDK